jgi:hypothetical protein
VIAVGFSSASPPWTTAQVRQRVFTDPDSTSAFFDEESHGQLRFTGDVYGWYTISPGSGCDYPGWARDAKQAAAAGGFDADAYDNVMYVFPSQSSCRWAGLAYLPGSESWVNGELSVRVTAHELGHNLGLDHAGSWACTDAGGAPVAISSNCTLDEYGDPFDAMGAYLNPRHNHGWNLQRLGLLQASNVETVTSSGTYSIGSALDLPSGPTTLRIPRTYGPGGAVQDAYYLEVRKSGGVFDDFSAGDPIVNGVSIRIDPYSATSMRSRLVDTHPGGSVADAPLKPGETFTDGQVRVTAVSAGGGGAVIDIALPGQPYDVQAPSAPTGLSHRLTGGGALLQWLPSTDNTGVSGYLVYRDGVQAGSTAATSFEDAGVSPGSHVYTVYAQDATGNRSASSAPEVVTVTGATPVGQRASATARDRRGPRVRLSRKRLRHGRLLIAVRARDSAGVARVELRIDGHRVRARRAGRLSYRWRMRRGRHRLVVRAVDVRGNATSVERRLLIVA